ncbi:unnamed protein product [Dracunculus medinensis]|uniref:Serine/threonine-protein phosphatase 2A activator n=1 Tax=Dracunculus medinensis TaxID=318479 RepID=A0A0N4U8X6_DRAME|nr:unnamed protein product [Dracunculus medinensis]
MEECTTYLFQNPKREILSVFDAYRDYLQMITELNESVKGIMTTDDVFVSNSTMAMIEMLEKFENWISEYPPADMADQRFGNKSFRNWYERLSQEAFCAIEDLLPPNKKGAVVELVPYLLDSFGNSIRIDYGSGHEACFLIFLLCLRKLGIYGVDDNKALVLRIFLKYLRIVRNLQMTYRMEPAGSRGVHALDDFQFIPFLWGSSQLIGNKLIVPDSYLNQEIVEIYASRYLFLDAIKHINEETNFHREIPLIANTFQTKTGPFHEHSNQLWNISAVQKWEKVNSGMFKMYEAEVLKKFPVIQHFVFGSLFSIEQVKVVGA